MTISESVRAWVRDGPESIPISRTLTRSPGPGFGPVVDPGSSSGPPVASPSSPGEHALERREGARAVDMCRRMGQRHEHDHHDQADAAQASGPARIAPIDERLEDRDEPPGQDEAR